MILSDNKKPVLRVGRFTPPPGGTDTGTRLGEAETYLVRLSEELEYLFGLIADGMPSSADGEDEGAGGGSGGVTLGAPEGAPGAGETEGTDDGTNG